MKKVMLKTLLLLTLVFSGLGAFADEKQEALNFFNSFVNATNVYSIEVPHMYSDDAKIIRQVVKPNGQTVDVKFSIDDYRKQMKLSSKIAKIKKYKNEYSNVSITKVPEGYKIDSLRKPSLSDYKLKSSMVVKKQPNGKWLIVKELMQTKEQIFLKYAK